MQLPLKIHVSMVESSMESNKQKHVEDKISHLTRSFDWDNLLTIKHEKSCFGNKFFHVILTR